MSLPKGTDWVSSRILIGTRNSMYKLMGWEKLTRENMYKDKIRKLRTNPLFSGQLGQVKCKKTKIYTTQRINYERGSERRVCFGGCLMRLSKHPF